MQTNTLGFYRPACGQGNFEFVGRIPFIAFSYNLSLKCHQILIEYIDRSYVWVNVTLEEIQMKVI